MNALTLHTEFLIGYENDGPPRELRELVGKFDGLWWLLLLAGIIVLAVTIAERRTRAVPKIP